MPVSSSHFHEIVKMALIGTVGMSIIATAGLFLDASLNNKHSLYWLFLFLTVSAVVITTASLCFYDKRLHLAAFLVLCYTYVCAICFSIMSGLQTTSNIMFGFTILLAGMFFGSKAILPSATVAVITFFLLYSASDAVQATGPQPSSATLYALFLGAFSVIGWLSSAYTERIIRQLVRTQMELQQRGSLMRRQLLSEYALTHKRQAEELMSIYQFAAVGRNATAILHDIANELSTLSLFLRDDGDNDHEDNIQHTLTEIESLVTSALEAIQPVSQKRLDVGRLVKGYWQERLQVLASAQGADIELRSSTNKPCFVLGNQRQLTLVLDILVQNAIEACAPRTRKKRPIQLIMKIERGSVEIAVKDFGTGISPERRKDLFKQPRTYKQNGHGIGLYIARQIIRHHFHGDLTLDDSQDCTMFVVQLPITRAPSPMQVSGMSSK
ncbi:hypothetical protein CL689_07390 [Candidatus Saccharibacteria bacterium]|nr:hypothetical protein [Candidatus Saccharibacteria bacterium]MBQ69841.1 hypothetical protein [Candidatus Saccharibacteria bacterium]|tara:strand:- start:4667 stop:5986 length:1320 start_codon:yes stop_codon:yes gene_type:complete